MGGAGGGGSGADIGSDAGSLTDFCTGAFARMVVNGIESGPSVHGTELPLDCCFAAEFTVMTATFAHFIVVLWRVPVGSSTTIPATFDLANPLPGWTVRVYVDCEPGQGNCNPAPDSYETGLQGTLHVGLGDSGTAFDMTLCLSVAEPAGVPHPIVHSLQLYAPHVITTY
jgi:hypothetical protein